MLVLDRAPSAVEPEIAQLADSAAAMLSIVDRQDGVDEGVKVFPPKHFRGLAERLLTLAARHDRRSSVLAISLPGDKSSRRDEAVREIVEIVRTTDALCGLEDGDLLLFLPETTGLGAQVCLLASDSSPSSRAIVAGGRGAAAAAPSAAAGRTRAACRLTSRLASPRSRTMGPRSAGSSSSPARAPRTTPARASTRSASTACPSPSSSMRSSRGRLVHAGPRSSYPLNVASTALFSLAARACKEATRGGEANVTTTLQPGLGVAAAARQVAIPRVHDVRGEPGCADVEAIVIEAEHGSWCAAVGLSASGSRAYTPPIRSSRT